MGALKYFTKSKTGNCGVQLWARHAIGRLGSCKGEISGTCNIVYQMLFGYERCQPYEDKKMAATSNHGLTLTGFF